MSTFATTVREVRPAQPAVIERVHTLTLTDDEVELLQRLYWYHLPGDSPLFDVLGKLGSDGAGKGWVPRVYGTEDQALRERITTLTADNEALRAELGKVSSALAETQEKLLTFAYGQSLGPVLSRFDIEAPSGEWSSFTIEGSVRNFGPDIQNLPRASPPDDHVEAPKRWKVQYQCTDSVWWYDYDPACCGSDFFTSRSAAYRWMHDRAKQPGMGCYPRRVVPQHTPQGVEPDRGYYTVQMFYLGQWNTAGNRRTVNGRTFDLGDKFATHEAASEALRLIGSKGINYRIKWHSNNA